jgi:hypothetical protein
VFHLFVGIDIDIDDVDVDIDDVDIDIDDADIDTDDDDIDIDDVEADAAAMRSFNVNRVFDTSKTAS